MTGIIEREIKVKLQEDPETFMRNLMGMGFRFKGKEEQEDIYFNGLDRDFRKTDEALRLRIVNGEVELTYKGPKLGRMTKSREEVSVRVWDRDGILRIMERLGYKPASKVRKRRYILEKDNFLVCIDTVEGLGDFVEIEGVNVTEEELVKFFEELRDKLKVFGEVITKSYLELKVEKYGDNSDSH
ncbi:MAG: class IV adenylate cyclase [Metallosphaera yellowstonensis]|jgi:adenylate cyclase class 2